MNAPTKIIGHIMAAVTDLLPNEAPGISVVDARNALPMHTSKHSVHAALTILEREGIAISERLPGPNGMPAWLFRRVGPGDSADNFEDAKLVYGDVTE